MTIRAGKHNRSTLFDLQHCFERSNKQFSTRFVQPNLNRPKINKSDGNNFHIDNLMRLSYSNFKTSREKRFCFVFSVCASLNFGGSSR